MSIASEGLGNLQAELDSAISELSIWEEQDSNRTDGSQAQDGRFEGRGQRLQARVNDLSHKLEEMKKAVQ
jgi:hypothetical protein